MHQGGDKGAVNRSKSLGSVLKEREAERGVPAAPEVEYELGNGDLGSDPGDEGAFEGAASSRRVVMMYDEYGNAAPMPMAKFYYDSVQPNHFETEDANSRTHDEEDSTRPNVSAPYNAAKNLSSDSDSCTETVRVRQAAPSRVGGEEQPKWVEDAEDHEYENDSEEEDPFANQFMRIQAPAAQLKDVSRVKKDLDHDKPRRKGAMMSGLQRAMSSVRIGDNSRARSTTSASTLVRQQSKARVSAAKIGRLMSFSREEKQKTEKTSDSAEEETFTEPERWDNLQRPRESIASKPGVRQGLAAVGRIMSVKKSKSKGLTRTSVLESHGDGQKEVESGNQSYPETSTHAKGLSRKSLTQVGHMTSINRKKSVFQANENESTSPNRVSFVNRASEADSVHSDISVDRERGENRSEKQSNTRARMSLTKIGRMMSFTRAKKQQTQKQSETITENKGHIGNSHNAHFSPLSSSTVSSKAVDATSSVRDATPNDGDRDCSQQSTSTSSRKEATRMKLRGAGRLLSFSRNPQTMAGGDSRGQSAEKARRQRDMGNRAQSVPPQSVDRGTEYNDSQGKGGEKLDGRANKFFYSELKSERIRATGLFGSERHIRVPVIAMAEYSGPDSRSKWYIDGFTLPHNAVRRECIDLYEILVGMAKCEGDRDITRDDTDDFEDWWKTASGFFRCYFELERRILFPWVDGVQSGEWEVEMALRKMKAMKDKLQEQLGKIEQVWNEKLFKDPGEIYGLVYRAVDEFVPRLVNYLADQEVLLPALVKGYYKVEDRLRVDKDMVKLFMGGDVKRGSNEEAHHNLILLIRWIANPRQLKSWIGKNLNSHARTMYASWYALYQEEHYRFVKTIRNRGRDVLAA